MSDFLRIATASPEVAVGNVEKNVKNILLKAYEADRNAAQIVVFPELCITGYSCGDLFFQHTLLEEAKKGLREIIEKSNGMDAILAVGLPVDVKGKLYNAAAIIKSGVLYGLIPKTFIPTYNEFYERRWFSSGAELKEKTVSCTSLGISDIQAIPVPIGNDLVFDAGFFRFGAEVCEDIWAAVSPGAILSLNGAEVILNLSASNEIIAKRNYRRTLVSQHSAAQLCIYAYSSASCSESTTDLIFSGHSMICEDDRRRLRSVRRRRFRQDKNRQTENKDLFGVLRRVRQRQSGKRNRPSVRAERKRFTLSYDSETSFRAEQQKGQSRKVYGNFRNAGNGAEKKNGRDERPSRDRGKRRTRFHPCFTRLRGSGKEKRQTSYRRRGNNDALFRNYRQNL